LKLFKPAFVAITAATIFFVLCATVFAAPLICIDPGHGGKDSGARSPDFKIDPSTNEITFISDGTTNTASAAGYIDGEINFTGLPNRIDSTTGNLKLWESDANLDISLRLRDLVRNGGYNICITRNKDCSVNTPAADINKDGSINRTDELLARCVVANNANATIFVSVHNNAYTTQTAHGTETYHYPGSTSGALLATYIQDELIKQVSTYDRGVKSASFTVLNGTNMPAVLVEGAFISNPDEVKLLLSPTFRQKMAQGVFNGIDKYLLTTLPRIAGSDRYETAVYISKEGWDSASTVILAKGDDFPDALAGAPLAYKYDAPMLLTGSSSLNSKTSDEIKRLKATRCIILGGTGAISDTVKSELEGMGLSVKRIAGNNRFETASEIAKEVDSSSQTAIITSGLNFPDALSISSYATKNQIPILLVPKDEVTADVKLVLSTLEITRTIIVGGTGAVSQDIENWLTDNNYNPEKRISGANRFETSALIAGEYFFAPTCAYVATGADFPDALSAACFAAKKNAPIVLVEKDSLPTDISSYIRDYASGLEEVILLGGNVPITDDVVREICAALYF